MSGNCEIKPNPDNQETKANTDDQARLSAAIDAYVDRLKRLKEKVVYFAPSTVPVFIALIETLSEDLLPYEETFGAK